MKQDKGPFQENKETALYTYIPSCDCHNFVRSKNFLYPQYPGLAYDPADPFNNQEEPLPPFEIQGLVVLTELDDSFVIDLKYATEDNFTGQVIYTHPICVIHKNTAQKLIVANDEFKEMGYRIKIWDAYRPFSAQQLLWDAASDKQYVGDPKKGSVHNRGAAVDITLVDSEGNELAMPTGFDDFSEKAHIDYTNCTQEQIDNRELLARVMVKHGFSRISIEWWHFNDTDANDYPILDIPLEDFIKD